jgi:hypothetical protein
MATVVTTRDQTTLNLLNKVKLVISFGIVPVKLLPRRAKVAVKMRKRQATIRKNNFYCHDKQPNYTRLTQCRKGANVAWYSSSQIILIEIQHICT